MPPPVLVAVPLVPIETDAFEQRFIDAHDLTYIIIIYVNCAPLLGAPAALIGAPLRYHAEPMRLTVGEWTFDDDANVLTNGGSEKKLEPRSAAVLVELIRNAGDLVSKEALIERVWQGQHISDHSVAVVVSDLRRIFGDSPRFPAYIETVPKRGYRLIAPVTAARRVPLWIPAVAAMVVVAAGWMVLDRDTPDRLVVADIQNVTGDADAAYIAHAFSETITIDLLALSEHDVVRWRDAALETAPAASYAVTGSIISDGHEPALAVHVSERESGSVLWGETFVLRGADFGAISRRVAHQVVGATGGRRGRASAPDVVPADVHERFWRARYLWSLREHGAIREAVLLLTGILEETPAFPLAHAALADIYAHKSAEELGLDRVDAFDEAVHHLERARELSPDLPELLVTEALLAFYRDRTADVAMEPIRRAVEVEPRNAAAWQTLGMIASALGRHEEALSAIDRARALDPLSASILWDRVWFLYVANEPRAALDAAEAARRVTAPVHVYEALIHGALGDDERALASWLTRARDRGLAESERARIEGLIASGAFADAYGRLAAAGYRESAVPLAALEVRAGNQEAAIDRLTSATPAPQSWWWHWVQHMPAFDGLDTN